jgi:hypothetical protein
LPRSCAREIGEATFSQPTAPSSDGAAIGPCGGWLSGAGVSVMEFQETTKNTKASRRTRTFLSKEFFVTFVVIFVTFVV